MNRNYDYLLKLRLVGDSGVGRTSILTRFCDDTFSDLYCHTTFTDFKIRTVDINGKKIKIQLWDGASNPPVGYALVARRFRSAMGILLVCDITKEESFRSIRYWMREIESGASPDVEVLMIGNKCDLSDSRVISKETGELIAEEYGIKFMETSAKDNINVEEAILILAKDVLQKLGVDVGISSKTDDTYEEKIRRDYRKIKKDNKEEINKDNKEIKKDDKEKINKDNKKVLIRNLNKAKREHGTIPVRFLKIIVAGSGAAGKTNFINLLMQKKFKVDHHSTNVVHTSHAVSFRMATFQESSTDDEVTWVELDSELEIGYLQSVLLPKPLLKSKLPISSTGIVTTTAPSSSTEAPVTSRYQPKTPKQQQSMLNWFTGLFVNPIKDSNLSTVDSILNTVSSRSGAPIYETCSVLNIITLLDTGGQPEYIHLLPTININPTVTFVVHNLSKSLNDQVLVEYSQHGKRMFTPYHLSYSNLDMIKFLMSTVNESVERPTCNVSDLQLVVRPGSDDQSYMCVVGTHADKVSHIEKKNTSEKLISLVNKTQCHASVWYQDDENVLFSVDNTTAGSKDSEDPVAKDMRKRIETLASKKEVYELPITWMLLQLEIRQVCSKKRKSYISFSDCVNIAKQSGLISNVEEVKSVLQYHHLLGVLIYFHKVPGLSHYVIVDHQWWFDKLSSVVCTTFQEDFLNYQAVRKLKYQGILSKELVQCIKWEDDIKEEYFFSLLIRMKIITPVSVKQDDIEEYFIPFVLSAYNLQHENKILSQYGHLQGEPLLIQFRSGLLPRGLFCSLIVQLLQYPFKGSEPHFSQEDKQHAFSNLFTFSLPNAYSMSLLDKLSYLEVQIRHPEKAFDNPVHCRVYNYLMYVLADVCNHLKFSFERLHSGFLCKCCQCTEDHIAVLPSVSSSVVYAKCSMDSIYQMELRSSHLIWFHYDQYLDWQKGLHHKEPVPTVIPKGKSRNDKPQLRELLLNVIHQYAAHWEDLGILLGVKDYDIANIAKDYRNQSVDACREMMIMWLQTVPSPTWGKLDDAISSLMNTLTTKSYGTDRINPSNLSEDHVTVDSLQGNPAQPAFKRPSMRLLHEIVVPRIAADWSIVADYLEYEVEYKQVIKEKCHNDSRRCCVDLLEDWLSSDRGVSPKSWSRLIQALKEIEHLTGTAEMIVQDLAKAGVVITE